MAVAVAVFWGFFVGAFGGLREDILGDSVGVWGGACGRAQAAAPPVALPPVRFDVGTNPLADTAPFSQTQLVQALRMRLKRYWTEPPANTPIDVIFSPTMILLKVGDRETDIDRVSLQGLPLDKRPAWWRWPWNPCSNPELLTCNLYA